MLSSYSRTEDLSRAGAVAAGAELCALRRRSGKMCGKQSNIIRKEENMKKVKKVFDKGWNRW